MSDTWARRKSRRAARRRVVILVSRSVAFGALALSGLLIALYLLFPVEEVRVEGNRMLPDSAIRGEIPERASLPVITARGLEREVDSNPWVKGVSVNKDWNSGIVTVQVEEREAVLNASLSGGDEVVLAEDGTSLPGLGEASLPQVELGRARLDEIRDGQRVLEENGVEVESVERVGAEGIELSVQRSEGQNALVIFSGEIGAGQARVLDELLRERPGVQYFDLRTPGRVVVGGGSGGDGTDQNAG